MEILLGFMIFKSIFLLVLSFEQLAAADTLWRWFTSPTDPILKDGASYDYLVVGAGAAGAAVAARLALAGADVLLVEAGGDPNLISEIPLVALALWGSELDWQYDTISNNKSCLSSRDRQCRFTSGKCLGGSTTINSMMYVRGNQRDFDDMGVPNWTWNDVKPYFLRYEGLHDLNRLPPSSVKYHNTSGIMEIGFFSDSEIPWHSRVIAGFEEMNFPFNADVNAKTQIGVSQVIGFVSGGVRTSTARTYLNNVDVKKRLKIAKNTYCTNVIIDENNVARGITVVAGIYKQKFNLYARREVILSAGAVGTPKILMLSGIGPVDHLMRLGITVRADLPVGDYLRDHIFPLLFILVDEGFGINLPNLAVLGSLGQRALQWLLTHKGPFASDGLSDVTAFLNTDCYDSERRRLVNDRLECNLPNSQFYSTFMGRNSIQGLETIVENIMHLDKQMFKQVCDVNVNYGLLISTFVLLQPWSHGTVRLASADPMDKPAIFPNFLSDDRDQEQMMRSIAMIEQLVETEVFRRHNAKLMHPVLQECPRYETDSKGYWQCYGRHLTYLVFHPVGTAALGRVLDERLRVRGVRRLRVADASALPMPLRGNPAAAVITVGERAADFILEDNFIK